VGDLYLPKVLIGKPPFDNPPVLIKESSISAGKIGSHWEAASLHYKPDLL